MIEEHRKTPKASAAQGVRREIVQRLVFALVNERRQDLEEGIASKSGDIDMVYLTATASHPPWWPPHYADEVGLFNVVPPCEPLCPRTLAWTTAFWQPAPLLVKLAAEGKTFN